LKLTSEIGANSMINLQIGYANPVVTTLQVLLTSVRPDGHFGPKTRSRVIEYQKKHIPKLRVDGTVGRYTWSALMDDNDAVTVDIIDVDELVESRPNKGDQWIKKPLETYTGQALHALRAGGSHPIQMFGQSNAVASMVQQIKSKVGNQPKLVFLRIFGHGAAGSQNIAAGKAALDKHLTSLDLSTLEKWAKPSLTELRQLFVPWGAMELHGCNVGQDHSGKILLQQIAGYIQVPVTAAIWEQSAVGWGGRWTFNGPTTTGFPYGGDLKGWSVKAAKG
jgi:Domain of unknown function (DUF4347)/Putative peptidoglycan binding domain